MPERQKIYAQKGGALNDQERLELCRLLVKAGYTVRIMAEKPSGSGIAVRVVEYWRSKKEGE